MANLTKSYLLNANPQAVAASQTRQAVSSAFPIREVTGALLIDVTVAASAVVAAGVNIIFQDSSDGVTWNDKKSTAVANAFSGVKTQTYVVQVAGDQAHFPMRCLGRVVVTTGAGDSLSITAVYVTQNW